MRYIPSSLVISASLALASCGGGGGGGPAVPGPPTTERIISTTDPSTDPGTNPGTNPPTTIPPSTDDQSFSHTNFDGVVFSFAVNSEHDQAFADDFTLSDEYFPYDDSEPPSNPRAEEQQLIQDTPCYTATSLCQAYNSQITPDSSYRFIPGHQEFISAFPSAGTSATIFFFRDRPDDAFIDDPVTGLPPAGVLNDIEADTTDPSDFRFLAQYHSARFFLSYFVGNAFERVNTKFCIQVYPTGQRHSRCTQRANNNDVLLVYDVLEDDQLPDDFSSSTSPLIIAHSSKAQYYASVPSPERIVFVDGLTADETVASCPSMPTGSYCIGVPSGADYFDVDNNPDAPSATEGESFQTLVAAAYAALVRAQWASLSSNNLAKLLNHCANVFDSDSDSILNLNCLLNNDQSALITDISALTASARPVSSLSAFPSFGFSVQSLPYNDKFGRNFHIPVSYSYSNGSRAPLTNPASSVLAPHNSNKPQALALHDKNAFIHAVKIPLGGQCLLAAAAAVEHSSFNGSSSAHSFSLGDSITPFFGASCSSNPRKNLSLTAWAAQRSPRLVNPDPSSLIQRLSGHETLFGFHASLLNSHSQITLSLRHGSGVRGYADVAGQSLAVIPHPWNAASLSLSFPFLSHAPALSYPTPPPLLIPLPHHPRRPHATSPP